MNWVVNHYVIHFKTYFCRRSLLFGRKYLNASNFPKLKHSFIFQWHSKGFFYSTEFGTDAIFKSIEKNFLNQSSTSSELVQQALSITTPSDSSSLSSNSDFNLRNEYHSKKNLKSFITLRSYQHDCINASLVAFLEKKIRRQAISLPVGSGKTVRKLYLL